MTLTLCFLGGGCVAAVGAGTVVATDKTPLDHVVSLVTGKDCSIIRQHRGLTYCVEDEIYAARPRALLSDDRRSQLLRRAGSVSRSPARARERAGGRDRRSLTDVRRPTGRNQPAVADAVEDELHGERREENADNARNHVLSGDAG